MKAKTEAVLPDTYPCHDEMFKEGWQVGHKFTLLDNRDFGEWWRFEKLRNELRRLRDPCSEPGFGHCATHCEGQVLLAEKSNRGNGIVRVLEHGPWRCLMCNCCEQGIAYFEDDGRPAPRVLGYQYLRVMVAAALSFIGLQQDADRSSPHRVLCIGLGTGALPGFLAHHLSSSLDVDVVEIDPVIVRVCREQLGCNFRKDGESRPEGSNSLGEATSAYNVFVNDAGRYVQGLASNSKRRGLAAIFLDAYDEAGDVPRQLLAPAFFRNCKRSLALGGVLVCNCFNGPEGGPARRNMEKLANALVEHVGPVYTLKVADQPQNVVLVSRCGEKLPRPGSADIRSAVLKATGGKDLGIEVARLVEGMLWAETRGPPGKGVQEIIELIPPRSTKGDNEDRFTQWRRLAGSLPVSSSECLWGDRVEFGEEEEDEDDEEEELPDTVERMLRAQLGLDDTDEDEEEDDEEDLPSMVQDMLRAQLGLDSEKK